MDPNDLEDKWWPKETPGTFKELPPSSCWICVSYCLPAHSTTSTDVTTLKVFSEGETYEFPAVYTAVFMLLDFQQLSCLSETKTLPRGTANLGRNLRNITFLDNLRRHILEESRGLDPSSRDICQIMKRWVLRLVNGVSNSKTHRRMQESVLTNVYSEFESGLDWKRGVSISDFELESYELLLLYSSP